MAAIHVLEHFHEWEALGAVAEWRRILKPGGVMILELPCMDKVFGYIAGCVNRRESMAAFMTLHAIYGNPIPDQPAMQHKYGWFKSSMRALLEAAGMREIRDCPPRYHFPFRDMRWECVK